MGRANGIGDAELLALPRWREATDVFGATERRVLDYAERMTATPVDVPDELFAALRAELGDAGLVELTASIAWENQRARFNHAFGIESQGFAAGAAGEGAVCLLPQRT